jgi:hypothetical protein
MSALSSSHECWPHLLLMSAPSSSAECWPFFRGDFHPNTRHPYAKLIEILKTTNHKPSIKINFLLHYWTSDNKSFTIRSHLTIFWWTFLFIFLIMGCIFSMTYFTNSRNIIYVCMEQIIWTNEINIYIHSKANKIIDVIKHAKCLKLKK